MPKGLKMSDMRGYERHWFDCGACGYRWEGASQTAKNLAFRLHSKCCKAASKCKLSNETFGHRSELESETAFIDNCIIKMKGMDDVTKYATAPNQ